MLLLTCPSCGATAEETEFAPGGEAHLRRAGPGSSDAEFEAYLFLRRNPRGVAFRALAPRLRLRQVVPPRPRHRRPSRSSAAIPRTSARRPTTLSRRSAPAAPTGRARREQPPPRGGMLIDRAARSDSAGTASRCRDSPATPWPRRSSPTAGSLVGRSFKYHRPRGIVASGVEEPNALVGLGDGAEFEPNTRATTIDLRDGLVARSQNHWPSLELRRRRARRPPRAAAAGGVLLQDLHPPPRRLEAPVRAGDPPLRRPRRRAAARPTPTPTTSPTPTSTCSWSAAAPPASRPRPRRAPRARG